MFGQFRSMTSASFAHASMTCSQLSSSTSRLRWPIDSTSVSTMGATRILGYAEHVGDSDRDEIRVLKRGEIREPDSVAGAIQQPGRGLQAKAGLARAARAGERDETGAGDQAAHLGELSLAANEARHLRREVVAQLRVIERPQWREDRGQAIGFELEDLLGPAEVLQPVQAEVPERGARRKRVAEQGSRREPRARSGRRARLTRYGPPGARRDRPARWPSGPPHRSGFPSGHAPSRRLARGRKPGPAASRSPRPRRRSARRTRRRRRRPGCRFPGRHAQRGRPGSAGDGRRGPAHTHHPGAEASRWNPRCQ